MSDLFTWGKEKTEADKLADALCPEDAPDRMPPHIHTSRFCFIESGILTKSGSVGNPVVIGSSKASFTGSGNISGK